MTKSNIKRGFIENGFIDKGSHRCPDFYQIICGTTRREVAHSEIETIIAKFVPLLKYQMEHGSVPDQILEDAGIPPDVDSNGNIVRREATINCESRQRARELSHAAQAAARQQVMDEHEAIKLSKDVASRKRWEEICRRNKDCEELIADLYKQRTGEFIPLLASASLRDFASKKVGVKLLEAFLHCREFRSETKTAGYGKWPKKGTLEEAKAGKDTLVRRVFDSRNKPIVLLPSASTNTSPNSTTPTSDSTDNNGWRKSMEEIARNTVTVGQPSFEQFEFVITGEWIKKSRDAFVSIQRVYDAGRTSKLEIPELQQQAESLSNCLRLRLKTHIMNRAAGKADHWVWRLFVRQDLLRVSALMIYVNHMQDNLERFIKRPDKCLLEKPSSGNFDLLIGLDRAESDSAKKNNVRICSSIPKTVSGSEVASPVDRMLRDPVIMQRGVD